MSVESRKNLMRVDGSIQTRSSFVAPVEYGLRTGDTVVVHPEKGTGPGRLLALVESSVALNNMPNAMTVSGTIQILAKISDQGLLGGVAAVPTFFGDVERVSVDIGKAYYGSVERATDPVTKNSVQPAALEVGSLLTNQRIPVALNACGFNRHTALLAQSGAGKSYGLGVIMEELLRKTQVRLVVLDPNGDYSRLNAIDEDNQVVVAESRDPLRYLTAIRKIFRGRHRCVALNLDPLDGESWHGVVAETLSQLWEHREDREPTIVVVDEAHNFAPAEEGGDLVQKLMLRIAAEGRKYGLWLVLASQRPQRLNATVISQCDNLIVMKLSGNLDVDYVAGAYGAVDRNMIQLVNGFRTGAALVVGRVVKSPTLMRFRERQLPETGGDISLNWGCAGPG